MKKVLISVSVVILTISIFFSCSSDRLSGYTTDSNGTYYKIHYQGSDQTKVNPSEIVKVNMDFRFGDSIIFTSTSMDEPMIFPMIKPMFKGDLYDALKLMGTGDSITVAIVADSFYLKTANLDKLPELVESGSYLYYDIKLLEHISNSDFQIELAEKQKKQSNLERKLLQSYLVTNEININPTSSGLYIIPIKEGRGSTPNTGDVCKVFLSVKELNGLDLYSNFGEKPIDIEFGSNFDTRGFMEGLGTLKTGEIAQFIVPSWIGFGSTGMEMVAPYTTLVYDVKLEGIVLSDRINKD